MKTAAKVFLILGMIFGFPLILPIILGCIAISKINNATKLKDIKVWGILSIFFVSLLGGIFMLCIDESDLKKPVYVNADEGENVTLPAPKKKINKVKVKQEVERLDFVGMILLYLGGSISFAWVLFLIAACSFIFIVVFDTYLLAIAPSLQETITVLNDGSTEITFANFAALFIASYSTIVLMVSAYALTIILDVAVFGIFNLLSGIFGLAVPSAKPGKKGLSVAAIVFGVLSGSIFTLVGGILKTASASKMKLLEKAE